MSADQGDQRVRRRVTTTVAVGKTAAGTYSAANKNIEYADHHFVTVVLSPGTTIGLFSVRAEPAGVATAGVTGFAKIEIESVNIATATNLNFEVTGFFDAFALIIINPITGGATPGVSVYVNSTIQFG